MGAVRGTVGLRSLRATGRGLDGGVGRCDRRRGPADIAELPGALAIGLATGTLLDDSVGAAAVLDHQVAGLLHRPIASAVEGDGPAGRIAANEVGRAAPSKGCREHDSTGEGALQSQVSRD